MAALARSSSPVSSILTSGRRRGLDLGIQIPSLEIVRALLVVPGRVTWANVL